MGASSKSVIFTLSRTFLILILIANIITWPLVYIIASNWINAFAYKVNLDPAYFALGTLITLLIAAFTLIIQTGKVALVNPVKILRYE